MCKRCRCNHRLIKCPKDVNVKLVSASPPFTHAWTPEKKVHQVMIESTAKNQTGHGALIQSKGTKTIYINYIRIINYWPSVYDLAIG